MLEAVQDAPQCPVVLHVVRSHRERAAGLVNSFLLALQEAELVRVSSRLSHQVLEQLSPEPAALSSLETAREAMGRFPLSYKSRVHSILQHFLRP